VLELREKIASGADAAAAGGPESDDLVAREALVELGYSVVEAEKALADVDPGLSMEERVRQALRRAA
jgi:Holliday junction resolvasome RuvABC DNA-binding subunit